MSRRIRLYCKHRYDTTPQRYGSTPESPTAQHYTHYVACQKCGHRKSWAEAPLTSVSGPCVHGSHWHCTGTDEMNDGTLYRCVCACHDPATILGQQYAGRKRIPAGL